MREGMSTRVNIYRGTPNNVTNIRGADTKFEITNFNL